jgi:hypothetical protein
MPSASRPTCVFVGSSSIAVPGAASLCTSRLPRMASAAAVVTSGLMSGRPCASVCLCSHPQVVGCANQTVGCFADLGRHQRDDGRRAADMRRFVTRRGHKSADAGGHRAGEQCDVHRFGHAPGSPRSYALAVVASEPPGRGRRTEPPPGRSDTTVEKERDGRSMPGVLTQDCTHTRSPPAATWQAVPPRR